MFAVVSRKLTLYIEFMEHAWNISVGRARGPSASVYFRSFLPMLLVINLGQICYNTVSMFSLSHFFHVYHTISFNLYLFCLNVISEIIIFLTYHVPSKEIYD